MKIRNTLALAAVFILAAFLFTACNGAEPRDNDNVVLAGFLEIWDSTLYITPVEIFMLYSSNDEHNFVRGPALHTITFIEQNDSQRLAEFGLTLDDFPSWVHIRPNWHNERHWYYVEQANIEVLSFNITTDTEFVFVDSNRQHVVTNVPDKFLPYLYPTVVHFIEVHNGKVVRLVQEFGFTM